MKKSVLLIVLILVIIFGVIFSSKKSTKQSVVEPPTQSQNTLSFSVSEKIAAKQAYSVALTEAKKFSSDSFLVDLNTSGVQKDGTSNTWYAYFYSPSKNSLGTGVEFTYSSP